MVQQEIKQIPLHRSDDAVLLHRRRVCLPLIRGLRHPFDGGRRDIFPFRVAAAPLAESLLLLLGDHAPAAVRNPVEKDGGLDAELPRHGLHIDGALDRVWDLGDRIGDVVDQIRLPQRVTGCIGEQLVRLEADEILLVRLHVSLHLFQGMGLGERIGVLPFRQQDDLDVQALSQGQVGPLQRGVDAGAVPVVHDGQVVREFVDQADLLDGQRGAAGGHDIAYAQLGHHHHVHVALDQDAAALPRDLRFREIDAQQVAALGIDLRFR